MESSSTSAVNNVKQAGTTTTSTPTTASGTSSRGGKKGGAGTHHGGAHPSSGSQSNRPVLVLPAALDENTLENHFKQVEDSIMGLSKILSALYLSTLSNSTTTLNQSSSTVALSNSSSGVAINPAGLVVPSISSAQQHFNSVAGGTGHQYQPSSSVSYSFYSLYCLLMTCHIK